MSVTDLPFLLQQFTMRYRAALLTKAALLAVLGLALTAVLAWRLSTLRFDSGWVLGVPATVAVVTGAGLGWWTYCRWPSRRSSAAYLDRLLGLKQRLITAEEFAGAPAAPALYPLLIADASQWVRDSRTRYPRPLDRTAAALLLLLLFALAWPLGGRSPLQQLARLPKPMPPPVQPPEPSQSPPPPPQNRQQQQQGGGGQQQQQSSSQSPSGSQQQPSSPHSGRDQTSQSPGGQSQQQQPSNSGRSSSAGGAKQDSSGQRGEGQSGQGNGQQQGGAGTAQAQQAQSSRSGSQSDSGKAQGGIQGAAKQARASSSGTSGEDAQTGAGSSQSLDAKAARAQSEGGSSGSPGDTALQQDIQQLLKEVSSEIQTLQAQIAAHGQPPPTAGTSTDPELYGASEPLGQTGAGNIPMQLKTDTTATTSRSRAGSGVGRRSGDVAADSPRTRPEPAQLSDNPLEETPGSRDTVPPEYRDIFDRLNRR